MKQTLIYPLLGPVALLAAVLPGPTGAQVQAPAAAASVPTAERYPEITMPTNAIEFLRNIKFAINHDLPAREWFYDLETQRRFLGVEGAVRRIDDVGIWVRSNKFGYMPAAAYPDGIPKTHFAGGITQGKECAVGMTFADGAPIYRDVEVVFGSDWKDAEFNIQRELHRVVGPATGPHGNDTLIYQLGTPPTVYRVVVGFFEDGSIQHLNFSRKF